MWYVAMATSYVIKLSKLPQVKFAEVIEINSVIAYGELYIYVDLLGDF